jgi:hypothetical protein
VNARDAISRSILLTLFLFVVALFVIRAPGLLDPDIWWHLRAGKWIFDNGAVPHTDPFSVYGADKPWIAYSWLFESIVYGLYVLLGLPGIVLYNVISTVAIACAVFALIHYFERTFVVTVVLAVLCIGAMLPILLTPRPWLFSILFFLVELYILMTVRMNRRTRRLWLLPPLFALWANIHIQFVYGFFLLGLATIESWLNVIARRFVPVTEQRSILPSTMIFVTASCMAATLFNPYHYRIYVPVFEISGQRAFYDLISELQAIPFRTFPDYLVLGLAVCAVFVLGRRQPVDCVLTPFLLTGFFVSFHSQRDVWFVVIASSTVLALGASDLRGKRSVIQKREILCILGALSILIGIALRATNVSQDALEAKVSQRYPAAAAAAIESRGYIGPLYNQFEWGGYLIWRLPHLPVTMDGRTNIHGVERTVHFTKMWLGAREWTSDPELASSGLIIASQEKGLTSLLRLDPRFELVYEDTMAAVFVPRSSAAMSSEQPKITQQP